MSASVRGRGNSTSLPSSTTTSLDLNHKSLLSPTGFILGKRVRFDDGNAGKDDPRVITMGPDMGSILGHAGGFWALPTRPDYGQQVWSFAPPPPEMVFHTANAAAPESAQPPTAAALFVQQQQAIGEASASRVENNYLPGHLNLLASLSSTPGGSGRSVKEDPN